MPAEPFTLRQADQARTDYAIIEDELEAIHKRLSQLPTRNEVWRAAHAGVTHQPPPVPTTWQGLNQLCLARA